MSWPDHARKHGHNLETCQCVGCQRYRKEPLKVQPKRKKHANSRSYLWLSDELDSRVRNAAEAKGYSLGELCRHAIEEYLDKEAG